MKKLSIIRFFILAIILINTSGCKKYLDAKPNQSLATPSSLDDLQSLLNNIGLNKATSGLNIGTDEYYLNYADWQTLDLFNAETHVWDPKAEDMEDWEYLYKSVFYANTVLDHLKVISNADQQRWNEIKGAALFFRAHSFYLIAQVYAGQYVQAEAENALGIPLRLSADFNKATKRSALKQTYDQIIQDLTEATMLLPDHPLNRTQPCKPSANALLARVSLQMGDYVNARDFAKACLQTRNSLMDFNALDAMLDAPIPIFNLEVLFYAQTDNPVNIYDWMSKINPELYQSFESNDLRKTIFFRDNGDGSFAFKGSYNGDIYSMFNGIATDEVYLILAEANARLGNKDDALSSLNTLLEKRWKTGTFTALTAANADEALVQVLNERRKELIYRGLRWSDLKRLNKEPRFAVTLQRVMDGQTYTLPPNDKRYTLLIPQEIISLTGITQNPR